MKTLEKETEKSFQFAKKEGILKIQKILNTFSRK